MGPFEESHRRERRRGERRGELVEEPLGNPLGGRALAVERREGVEVAMVEPPGQPRQRVAHGDEVVGHPLAVELPRDEADDHPPTVAVRRLGGAAPEVEAVRGLERAGDFEGPTGHARIVT